MIIHTNGGVCHMIVFDIIASAGITAVLFLIAIVVFEIGD